MKKDFIVGDNECSIIIKKDAITETKTGTHPYTHDDYVKEVKTHSCIGVINNNIVIRRNFEVWSGDEIKKVVIEVEDYVRHLAASIKKEYDHLKEINKTLK
jgi:hypothetical protein